MKRVTDEDLAELLARTAAEPDSPISMDPRYLRPLLLEVREARARAQSRCFTCWRPLLTGQLECGSCRTIRYARENE